MIDLFSLRATDTKALGEIIDRLHCHCEVAQVTQFLEDLARWEQVRHRPGRKHEMARLELEQWQDFISRLPEVAHDDS